jgi:pyrroline-5-carboxylate reductase
MPEADARTLALQTLVGTAKVLSEGTDSPAEFIRAVTSAKGTTEAGLKVMDASDLGRIARDTLAAAATRSAELRAI